MKEKIFTENPYDMETVFEAIKLAQTDNRELFFLDKLLTEIRKNSRADITETTFKILSTMSFLPKETSLLPVKE